MLFLYKKTTSIDIIDKNTQKPIDSDLDDTEGLKENAKKFLDFAKRNIKPSGAIPGFRKVGEGIGLNRLEAEKAKIWLELEGFLETRGLNTYLAI